MELDLMAGIDAEMAAFEAKESGTFWPDKPTPCPVPECGDFPYASHQSFKRHWDSYHVRMTAVFRCPNCSKMFGRSSNCRRHQRQEHRMTSDVGREVVLNNKFVDPEGLTPYHVNQRRRLAQKRAALPTPGTSLVTGSADCRDELVTFNTDGSTTGKKFKKN